MESELNRCRDRLDFHKYVIAVLCLAIVLLAAMLYFCKTAHAGGFGEVGSSHFATPPNGTWWQDQYPHEFRTDSNYFRIGYEGEPQKVLVGSVAWRVSWFDLGNYSTRALATSDEVKYFQGACNFRTCAPPDYYETRGSVRGLLFSGVYRKGPLFFEGGASITRQKFYLHQLVIDNRSGNGPAGNYTYFNDTHTAIGYMASLGMEFRKKYSTVDKDVLTIAFGYWLNGKASEFYAAGNTPGIDTVKTFAVGYRF